MNKVKTSKALYENYSVECLAVFFTYGLIVTLS